MEFHEFTTEPYLWQGDAAWTFAAIPEDIADEIADTAVSGGFGSVRVEVTIGDTTWQTSLFPDSRAGTYVLPLKQSVRRAEGIEVGEPVAIRIRVSEPLTRGD